MLLPIPGNLLPVGKKEETEKDPGCSAKGVTPGLGSCAIVEAAMSANRSCRGGIVLSEEVLREAFNYETEEADALGVGNYPRTALGPWDILPTWVKFY